MTDSNYSSPERIWAESFKLSPTPTGMWMAMSVRPWPGVGLVEYVRADLMPKLTARTADELRYDQLIYAVATKHPGEDRFETALRYIMERERMGHQSEANEQGFC